MADLFAWKGTTSSNGTTTAKVRRADFNDGYSQASADGINPTSRAWQMSFTYPGEIAQEIVDFIDAHIGVSFLWKPPLAALGYYQCDGHSETDLGGEVYTITATFQQTFQP